MSHTYENDIELVLHRIDLGNAEMDTIKKRAQSGPLGQLRKILEHLFLLVLFHPL